MAKGVMVFFIYQDDKGEWRWQIRSANGRTMADSGEGYKSKQNCQNAVDTIKAFARIAQVKEPHADVWPGKQHIPHKVPRGKG